jgi:prepilin-type N-terminal cleavage/methylation domain-containing protein
MKLLNFKKNNHRGFTLLEILLVVGIIAILAGIVIVAVNPARQLATVRNTERKADIKQIDSAIKQYYIDHGTYPSTVTTGDYEICDTGSVSATTTAVNGEECDGSQVNLSSLVPLYLTAIPKDPQATTSNSTNYTVRKGTADKLITQAPEAELDAFIAIGIATTTTSTAVDMPTDLIGHWKMNDNAGNTTIVGTVGGNGTARYSNTSDMHADGQVGGGSLTGCIDLSTALLDGVTLRNLSFSVWVKPNTLDYQSGQYAIVAIDQGAFFLSLYNGHALVGTGASYFGFTDEPAIEPYVWTHIAITKDGTTNKLYINGVKTLEIEDSQEILTVNNQENTIGCLGASNPELPFTNGDIDDVRVYNQTLTGPATGNDCTDEPETDICLLYNDGAGTEN